MYIYVCMYVCMCAFVCVLCLFVCGGRGEWSVHSGNSGQIRIDPLEQWNISCFLPDTYCHSPDVMEHTSNSNGSLKQSIPLMGMTGQLTSRVNK